MITSIAMVMMMLTTIMKIAEMMMRIMRKNGRRVDNDDKEIA